jgi:ABC-type proline/glycine betaine transport system ATPase subunit
MIELENVSKIYPGLPRPAVDRVDLVVPEGATCVLIGPSGCGKTTTMRMVNRLIEPTQGRILVGGEDVTHADPVLLRRRIGYVIQQIGLFPHMTIARNVATVPELLGWPEGRIRSRVDEMLQLVGWIRPRSGIAIRATSREGSASASGSRARSRPIRPSCSWMSLSARSIPSYGRTSRTNS